MEIRLIQEILERLVRLETKLDNYNGLRDKLDNTSKKTDVQAEQIADLELRIRKLEESNTWLWRTIAGTLIVGFMTTAVLWRWSYDWCKNAMQRFSRVTSLCQGFTLKINFSYD